MSSSESCPKYLREDAGISGTQAESDDFFPADEISDEEWTQLTQSEYDSDEEYLPSQTSGSDGLMDSDEFGSTPGQEKSDMKHVIVDKELLLELFKVCRVGGCGAAIDRDDVTMTTKGAAISVRAVCCNSHETNWHSSTRVGESKRKMFRINIELASYVVLCGLDISQVVEYFSHLSLECISRRFFFYFQTSLIHRAVWATWCFSHNKEIAKLKEMKSRGEEINLSGDGRYDSPGYCAHYCTCSLQCLSTKKIISTWTASKHVVSSSAAMETYATKTLLKNLVSEHELTPDTLTTDRSSSMKKMISEFNDELPEGHPKIHHLFDIWHWIKSVTKQLWEASKTKACGGLSEWIPSISNQLWWCFSSSIGNLAMLKEKINSIPFHLSNRHFFPSNKHHTKCSHGELEGRAWLDPDSKAIAKVRAALYGHNGCRMDDLAMMTQFTHTGELENFHSLVNKYCSKQFFYTHISMQTRTACAALDYNCNVDRDQAITAAGVPRFDLVKQRHGRKYYAKMIKSPKDHAWRDMVVHMIVECVATRTKPSVVVPILDDVPSVRIAIVKPNKAEAIQFHRSRMLLSSTRKSVEFQASSAEGFSRVQPSDQTGC